MARQTNNLKLYELIYYATSRSVHFNVVELFRRVWWTPGQTFTISSNDYERYWAAFALSWGYQIYCLLVASNDDLYPNEVLTAAQKEWMTEMMEKIGRIRQVPIVTEQELKWPNRN